MAKGERPLTIAVEGYTLIDNAELLRLTNIESRAVCKLNQLKQTDEDRFTDRRKAHIEAIAFVLGIGEISERRSGS